jgi:S1-C subfamily serine protease
MIEKKSWIILLIIILAFLSCSTKREYQQQSFPNLGDERYISELPYQQLSEDLENISTCVKMVNSVAYYKTYTFHNIYNQLTLKGLRKGNWKLKAIAETYYNEPRSGTSTIFYYKNGTLAILTCAHVVDFPDTVITYYEASDEEIPEEERRIQSVSIKERQINYIIDIPEYGELEILKSDSKSDIAVLVKEFTVPEITMPVFDYAIGDARELNWGSYVYIFGYPLGNQMITKGIVSSPNKDIYGTFMIDALFNKGFSGGLILAISPDSPHLEMVGLARSVSADYGYYLIPTKSYNEYQYDERFPYEGHLFVKMKEEINYGITYSIPVGKIEEFFDKNEDFFLDKGYDFRGIFDGK